MSRNLRGKLASFTPLCLLAAAWIIAALATPGFAELTWRDGRLIGPTVDVFVRGAQVMWLALGLTLVIAGGGVDLSVGSVMAISSVVAARALAELQCSALTAGLLGVGVGASIGALNGLLVVRFALAPIVATLVTLTSGRGVAELLANGRVIAIDEQRFQALASGSIAGIPLPVASVALAALALLVAKRAFHFGLSLEATGDNPRAARLAGIAVARVWLATYVISGACAGFAGLLNAADIHAADSSSCGRNLELDAILAVVLGGTRLEGGRARIVASLVGALTLQTLTTVFLMHGVSASLSLIFKAVVVIVAASITGSKSWLRRARGGARVA